MSSVHHVGNRGNGKADMAATESLKVNISNLKLYTKFKASINWCILNKSYGTSI